MMPGYAPAGIRARQKANLGAVANIRSNQGGHRGMQIMATVKTILVATDFSEASAASLAYGRELARAIAEHWPPRQLC